MLHLALQCISCILLLKPLVFVLVYNYIKRFFQLASLVLALVTKCCMVCTFMGSFLTEVFFPLTYALVFILIKGFSMHKGFFLYIRFLSIQRWSFPENTGFLPSHFQVVFLPCWGFFFHIFWFFSQNMSFPDPNGFSHTTSVPYYLCFYIKQMAFSF
jgi:hypothetical protein